MSSKLNIHIILSGHLDTLKDANTDRRSYFDLMVFFGIPILISVLFLLCGAKLSKDISSLLVNFGAIFTALLLSVLVLVYDQSNKVKELKSDESLKNLKIKLLDELYYNICYSILVSIALVVVCLLHSIIFEAINTFVIRDIEVKIDYAKYLTTPLAMFLMTNVVLTIVMVVKRMHALLTTELSRVEK